MADTAVSTDSAGQEDKPSTDDNKKVAVPSPEKESMSTSIPPSQNHDNAKTQVEAEKTEATAFEQKAVENPEQTELIVDNEAIKKMFEAEGLSCKYSGSCQCMDCQRRTQAEQAEATASERRAVRYPGKTVVIMDNKSINKTYKYLVRKMKLPCTLSDSCKCPNCQANYLKGDYEDGDHTDGGLGAGTPMFIAEQMHWATCSIL